MRAAGPLLLFCLCLAFSTMCAGKYPLKLSTWSKTEMFFGLSVQRDLGNGTIEESLITYSEFQHFVDDYVTPVFPDGLTYLNASGQWLSSTGVLVTEPSIYMIVYYEDSSVNEESIQQIVQTYMSIYHPEAVLYSFIPARVCTTPNFFLSSEETYRSPYTGVALTLAIVNSIAIICAITLTVYYYRTLRKQYRQLQ